MPLQLGTTPQPDFDQPIELIKDCHRRIEYFFEILLKITQLQGKALDQQHHQALEKSLNYFKFATPKHTQDEENSVFSRLREFSEPQAIEAIKLVETLELQHKQADIIHTQIDAFGRLWLKNNTLKQAHAKELQQLVIHLQFFYSQHIAIEENHVFPAAQSLFSKQQLQDIGNEMKQRRNLNPGRPGSKCAERRIKQFQDNKQVI